MPVHQDIYTVGDCRIHDDAGTLLSEIRVVKIALRLVLAGTKLHSDGCTDNLGIPVLNHMADCIGVIESWPETVPAEAHSFKFNSVARLVHQGRAFNMEVFHFWGGCAGCEQSRRSQDAQGQ